MRLLPASKLRLGLGKIAIRGQYQRSVVSDDGLIGLHGAGKFIERHSFRTLIIRTRVDFCGFRIRQTADLLNLTVGFRLDLVQVAHTVTANSGRLAVAL